MTGATRGISDLHSHLVPGVDDGAQTLEESLEGVARMVEVGVTQLAVTPHFQGSLTLEPVAKEARLEEMEMGWAALEEAVGRGFPGVALHRGYEVMLDVPNPDFSDSGLGLAGTTHVLVEWPRLRVPPKTPEVLVRLREDGVRPIVAHPERYHGLDRELELVGRWREAGARLQVNHGSLMGRYGDEPRERALVLLERGWVDLLSSDFHGKSHLKLFILEVKELFHEMDGVEQFDTLTCLNPARILAGDDPVPVQPLGGKPGVWEKMRSLIPGLGGS